MLSVSYPWPVPPGYSGTPSWTSSGFRIDNDRVSVLSYGVGTSGWADELTAFHEDNAGSDHFIDRASRAHALGQIKRHATQANPVILEVGSSSGFLLEALREELPSAFVIGSDYVRGPLEAMARRRPDIPLLQFDLVRCPLPDNSVDVVVLLNVLEHIEDDAEAVRQVYRILKPAGAFVCEVPAGPHLFDVYDKVLMHYRRYQLRGLCGLLSAAGFTIAHASHLGALFYPGFWYVKRKNKRFLSAPEEVQQQVVARAIRKSGRNRLFEAVMWVEDRLRNWFRFPFGIRCLATGVKGGD
jgi:SAM-dependent methyltransferase